MTYMDHLRHFLLMISIACPWPLLVNAQVGIWSPDVANIIYSHCTTCHHDGGIGPFSLMSYSDAVAVGSLIPTAVTTRHMPPWPADPAYRHFANENVLTQAEIVALVDWVNNGAPLGDINLEPDPPTYLPSGSVLDNIDLTVAIEPYTLQYNTDEYRWFVIENNSLSTLYINKMEVLPGLKDIVHHCDISYDVTGNSMAFDQQDPLPGFNSSTGSPTYSYYMNAWQPGGDVVSYPQDWGIAVPPGADFVLEIHYGPGGIGQTDSTLINLQFTGSSPIRPISVGWTLGQNSPTLVDGPFFLPANTTRTYHQQYTVPNTRSYLAICPHMHLLGKSYRVWYETPLGDSIPLVDIPQWDLHWQRYYYFQTVEVIPAGSVIKSEVVYDNTMFNPYNPNVPPQNVGLGASTTDEMLLCFFIWANYQPGDENIIIDSTIIAGIEGTDPMAAMWSVFPNPCIDRLTIEWPSSMRVNTIRVLDPLSREVAIISNGPFQMMEGTQIDLNALPNGPYLLQLATDQGVTAKPFFKQN